MNISLCQQRRPIFLVILLSHTFYILKKKNITKTIKDTEYEFSITVAVCSECGEEMSLPGLMDKNVQIGRAHV